MSPLPSGNIAPALLVPHIASKAALLPSATLAFAAFAPTIVVTSGEISELPFAALTFTAFPPTVDNIALDPLEPSGSWVTKEDQFLVFSRDGKNWDRVAYIGSSNWNTSYYWDHDGSDLVLLSVDISSDSFKTDDKGIPDFSQSSGGDGIGLCQWIAKGPGWVARTTTQLRTSTDGILWVDEDSSAPANWSTVTGGLFRWSPFASLFVAFGNSLNTNKDQYFTSANGTSWTQRTFPVDWTRNGQGGNIDWFVDDGSGGDIALMGLGDGRIYSSTDLISWTLRHTAGVTLSGLAWNPVLGAFYAAVSDSSPNNLISSSDGITWATVAGNNLSDHITAGQISVDPSTGLMYIELAQTSTDFSGTAAVSINGIAWSVRYPRSGNSMGHVPFKLGPVISDVLTISVDPITISDSQSAPTTSLARLFSRNDCTLDEQTTTGGISQIGTWAVEGVDGLNTTGREVRLEQLTGDTLTFSSGLDTWLVMNFDKNWGYQIASGTLTGTFTLRFRDRITLVEDTNSGVLLTLTASST